MAELTTFAPTPFAGPIPTLEPRVELGYYPWTEQITRWDNALWNDAAALWEGDAPLNDVTCNVLSIAITEGRDQPLERFRPGSCTVVLEDPQGLYSPWAGPSADAAAFTAVRVGIDLIVTVDDGTTIYPRFAGIVEQIVDDFPDQGARHTVTFQAFDYSALLAAFDGLEQAPAGAGELTGARLGRIVHNAGYAGELAFDAGTVTVQATTLAKNALDEAGITVDTEFGALWCARDGVLTFRDRNGLVGDPRYTTVQAIFGDDDDGPADEICYTAIELAHDTDQIRNIVSVAPVGGSEATLVDLTSIALFAPRTYRRTDLIHDQASESTVIAQRHLDFYAYAATRVESLEVDLTTVTPTQQATVLALDTLDRIQVRRRAVGFQMVADLQIQGMAERIEPGAWTVTFQTFSADAIFDVALFDVAVWDSGLWGY